MTAEVLGLARYGGRSTGQVPGGTGKVASAIVQRPRSDMDREKTERCFAHKVKGGFLLFRGEVGIRKRFRQRTLKVRPGAANILIRDGAIRDSVDT